MEVLDDADDTDVVLLVPERLPERLVPAEVAGRLLVDDDGLAVGGMVGREEPPLGHLQPQRLAKILVTIERLHDDIIAASLGLEDFQRGIVRSRQVRGQGNSLDVRMLEELRLEGPDVFLKRLALLTTRTCSRSKPRRLLWK